MSAVGFDGVRVCVAGIGVTGASTARVLADRGARVVVVDGRDGDRERSTAAQLERLGAEVRLGAGDELPEGVELVVTSPGWRPTQPLLVAAAEAGVPVWGDVELAWRLRPTRAPWLGVTGTNGKTTTVQMLASILTAAGLRTVAAGNVGHPVLDAVLADPPHDVLAVELSSFQLHWTQTVEFDAAAVLNIAPDHLDWHGSLEAYAAAKALIWRGGGVAVVNADDDAANSLSTGRADTVSFTLGEPAPGQLGVRDGWLVDAATPVLCHGIRGRAQGATVDTDSEVTPAPVDAQFPPVPVDAEVRLAPVDAVQPPAPHNVANALAAAGLARALDCVGELRVPPEAVADGLRSFAPGAHRIAHVATVGGVDFVDDSKATNPHAAAASLQAFESVVWVAGGLAKGARFEEVVASAAPRLRAAVLIGADRALVAEALARHAPDVPVVVVPGTDTGAMDDAVRAAHGLARPGDTVLLAPACASMDMFRDYAERGDAFAAAARRLAR